MSRSRLAVVAAGVAALAVTGGALAASGVLGGGPEPEPAGPPVVNLPAARAAASALVALGAPPVAGAPSGGAGPTTEGLGRVLGSLLAASDLGRQVSALVVDPTTGAVLFERNPDVPLAPASVTKLATATAALAALGAEGVLTTRVVYGAQPDQIVLVGGGDPTLSAGLPGVTGPTPAPYPDPARLNTLAEDTARTLHQANITNVRLAYDDTLFVGSAVNPAWEKGYVSAGVVSPVTALSVDEGCLRPKDAHGNAPRSLDPSRAAAQAFAEALRRHGVTAVELAPSRAEPGAEQLAAVSSPPVSVLVEQMLENSDNDLAEALARQVAVREGLPASFEGAAQAIPGVLGRIGVDGTAVSLYDGSGLTRATRVTARAFGQVLVAVSGDRHPELRPVVTGLPVAGFIGTLGDRYAAGRTEAGGGLVRAKTGTLEGVSSLAGLTTDADGQMLAFVFLADQVAATNAARLALDQLATALTSCGCR